MNQIDGWSYFLLFGVSLGTGFLLTRLARYVAPKFGLVDNPGGRKKHRKPTPLMGGVAVYLTMAACVSCVLSWQPPLDFEGSYILWLLLSGGLICVVGLVDDKWTLRARDKFVLQIAACLPFAFNAITVESLQLFGMEVGLGPLAIPLLVFWLVACANIVNLLDGVDGLAGTIGLFAAMSAFVLAQLNGSFEVAVVAIVLTGGIGGFLVLNRPPASIFLGDAGSLTIGFLVGGLMLKANLSTSSAFGLVVPSVVMSIPAFDTLMAIFRRKLTGRGIGEPDRGHFHHCLLDRGCTSGRTVLIIGAYCLAMAAGATIARFLRSDLLAVVLACLVLSTMVRMRVFGHREFILAKRFALRAGEEVGYLLRTNEALGSDDSTRDDLWRRMCELASEAGAVSMAFEVCDAAEPSGCSWSADGEEAAFERLGTVTFQLCTEGRTSGELSLQVVTPAAMRRVSEVVPLADRLIELELEERQNIVPLSAEPALASLPATRKAA